MKRLLLILVPVVVLLGGFLIWWTQPEKVVKRRVIGFLQTVNVEESAGNFVKGTRGEAVQKYLAEKVTLDGPAGDDDDYTKHVYTRADLVSTISMLATAVRSITIQKPEFETVEIDGDTATVQANVDATVQLGDRQPIHGVQKVTMTWDKTPEGWQLSKAAWTQPVR